MKKVERALLSVYDKTGIAEFARELRGLGVEIISTGGTARLLKEEGIPITNISDYTGFPEMLDGRVKTLHPKVHAGLLALRNNESHKKQMKNAGFGYIDLVVVNLYPFEQTISKNNVTLEEAIENIDIGGPSMLRSAAKNYRDVAVVVNPSKYELVLKELKENKNTLSEELKMRLAVEVFQTTSRYDALISSYLKKVSSAITDSLPGELSISCVKKQNLRYGENPHQKAAFFEDYAFEKSEPSVIGAKQLHGKELSFNNIIDLNAALEIVKEFTEPFAVIIKHTNPCGAAVSGDICSAYKKALETDPLSAFGSIVGFNRGLDEAAAVEISKLFVEAVICPSYTKEALGILEKKKNIRILEIANLTDWYKNKIYSGFDLKKVTGGVLVQDRDVKEVTEKDIRVVTKKKPTEKQVEDMLFAWKIVKHVKSNAIVYVKDNQTIGIGAGQMSRVDSSKIAVMKAQKGLKGSVMASDAFLPFRDNIDTAAAANISAIIQPGGSVKDQEVIDACNEHDMAMVFTGVRHFKH
ncbi:bifunctional phosphoribosylaminoimidazolecarboxamide formyltransferase/IMP cyclohydrolase [bacterium]|jgi:phosphoribosylaminoimidazolecarboxamide formyltransferase/IMP cyclohydrolase|nr:bifunctional phosphoribosylaminoimidazolecarboxamide formyltransferase/IMP cyclohydrolase [bacterium]